MAQAESIFLDQALAYSSSFPCPANYFHLQVFILLLCASLSAIVILLTHTSPYCYREAFCVLFFSLNNIPTKSLKPMEKMCVTLKS